MLFPVFPHFWTRLAGFLTSVEAVRRRSRIHIRGESVGMRLRAVFPREDWSCWERISMERALFSSLLCSHSLSTHGYLATPRIPASVWPLVRIVIDGFNAGDPCILARQRPLYLWVDHPSRSFWGSVLCTQKLRIATHKIENGEINTRKFKYHLPPVLSRWRCWQDQVDSYTNAVMKERPAGGLWCRPHYYDLATDFLLQKELENTGPCCPTRKKCQYRDSVFSGNWYFLTRQLNFLLEIGFLFPTFIFDPKLCPYPR